MVTFSNLSPSTRTRPSALSVDDFRREAALGDELSLQYKGEAFKLVATGMTASGRSVAWVEPNGDVTGMFVAALESTYGSGLSQIVAKELGLTSMQGKPLLSRTVVQALSMAETVGTALDGIRFAEGLTQGPR